MNNLYVEVRSIDNIGLLAKDIAHHMRTRCSDGNIAIVAKRPELLMPTVKMWWKKEIQTTKDTQPHEIGYFKSLSFNVTDSYNDLQANILFSTVEEFKLLPPICRTLYVTGKTTKYDLHMISSWMPPESLVILYVQKSN